MDDYNQMLQELLDLEEGLSDFEVTFIESLAKMRNQYGQRFQVMLSDKQISKLRQIHEDRIK